MNAQAISQLNAGLDALVEAVAAGDFARAGQLMSSHDQQLRRFIACHDAPTPLAELQALHARQLEITATMAAMRDEVALHLRGSQKQSQAVLAYQGAGA